MFCFLTLNGDSIFPSLLLSKEITVRCSEAEPLLVVQIAFLHDPSVSHSSILGIKALLGMPGIEELPSSPPSGDKAQSTVKDLLSQHKISVPGIDWIQFLTCNQVFAFVSVPPF